MKVSFLTLGTNCTVLCSIMILFLGGEQALAQLSERDELDELVGFYESYIQEEQKLKDEWLKLVLRLRDGKATYRSVDMSYRACKQQKWHSEPSNQLSSAAIREKNNLLIKRNRELSKERAELYTVARQYEDKRKEIERSHRVKGPQYAKALRNWVDERNRNYRAPFEKYMDQLRHFMVSRHNLTQEYKRITASCISNTTQ